MKDNKVKDSKMEMTDKIIFKNDGFPFRQEDWDRLKKIAEGNPDEQKVKKNFRITLLNSNYYSTLTFLLLS